MPIKPDFSIILATLLGLALFGTIYNTLYAHLDRHRLIEGYTALTVALGCAVTVILTGFMIGWLNMGLVLLAFAFAGTPMIIGSWWRHVSARAAEQKDLRNER